jgi:pimeloyl-[acyl-carrier protein] synthase
LNRGIGEFGVFDFNPLSPDFQFNPYAYYHGLRQAAPVFYWDKWGIWFLSRYADCVSVLKDSRVGHEIASVGEPAHSAEILQPPDNQRPLWEIQRDWMLQRDPPVHTRLRGLVHKAFTPRTVERLRSHIQEITDNLLDAVEEKGCMDVIADLAYPLPVMVIAELLGVPASDQVQFRHWSRDLAKTLELTDVAEVYDRGAAATVEFSAYLRTLVAERRKEPKDDLLSALVAAEEAGDKLTEKELIATAILLLIAGHETTINLIGNGVLALLRHPDHLAKLKNDPSLAKNAVEEILRYDSPVQLTTRIALEDIQVGGHTIRRGQAISMLLGAANRDPEQFPDPDTFDITRSGADKHVGFGNGIHFCLGAPLARVEGEIALSTLFRRLPNLTMATDAPKYRETFVLRGLETLPVNL